MIIYCNPVLYIHSGWHTVNIITLHFCKKKVDWFYFLRRIAVDSMGKRHHFKMFYKTDLELAYMRQHATERFLTTRIVILCNRVTGKIAHV